MRPWWCRTRKKIATASRNPHTTRRHTSVTRETQEKHTRPLANNVFAKRHVCASTTGETRARRNNSVRRATPENQYTLLASPRRTAHRSLGSCARTPRKQTQNAYYTSVATRKNEYNTLRTRSRRTRARRNNSVARTHTRVVLCSANAHHRRHRRRLGAVNNLPYCQQITPTSLVITPRVKDAHVSGGENARRQAEGAP